MNLAGEVFIPEAVQAELSSLISSAVFAEAEVSPEGF